MKIIIVDDDKLVCDSLKIILGAQPASKWWASGHPAMTP